MIDIVRNKNNLHELNKNMYRDRYIITNVHSSPVDTQVN